MPATPSRRDVRLRDRWRFALVGVATASILVTAGLAAAPALADQDGYATWEDVVAAEGNVERQQQLISEIESQISGLDSKVSKAAAEATAAGEAHGKAQTASSDKFSEVTLLQEQATAAATKADESRVKAGQLAASMSSRGAGDPKLALFLNPGDADTLLYQLGTISKLSEQTDGIYNQAVTEKNTADVLGEQATVAHEELAKLETEAKTKFDAAASEQVVLQNEKYLADQKKSELKAMIAPLKEQRDVTAADYAAGEKIRTEQSQRANDERAKAAAAYQEQAYQDEVANAEAAGVTPPAKPEISKVTPPLADPVAPANPNDPAQLPPSLLVPEAERPAVIPSVPPVNTPTPSTSPKPSTPAAPAPAPAPAEPAPSTPAEPAPSTPAEPTPVDPQPTTPAPTTEPSTPPSVEPTPTTPPVTPPTTAPEPTTPDIEILPEEPKKPDIELVPEPAPEPEPAPAPEPEVPSGPPGVLPGYFGPISSGVVTDEYGMRLHPIAGVYRMHNGLDLGVNGGTCGAPLYAVHSGTVTYAGYNGGFGNHVVLDIGGGVQVSYSHIMDGGINVNVGQSVGPGDVIAYAGTTGSSTGCHLHFELKYFGQLMDPKPWLASAGIFYY